MGLFALYIWEIQLTEIFVGWCNTHRRCISFSTFLLLFREVFVVVSILAFTLILF